MEESLTSAKYFNTAYSSEAPVPPPPTGAPVVRSGPSPLQGMLRATKVVALFVITAVVACSGMLFWLNRHDLQSSAQAARRRTSNPIDFMLWFGGSDKTFEDVISESNENAMMDIEAMRQNSPLYNGEFDNLDMESPVIEPVQLDGFEN